ncbi:adenomatous polyposis coli protein isoform X2 [Fopius arisanus]|uniref:Adenomatous polyposis coli protein isoform X2 n=1 Tax=Fopius arisanus TaxID=64838 RepID=A0A0C9QJ81_9HYME|nr:PREDICTED: adenomatous polyposis coli protein-like isoform X2 [Fopius arisanus]
MLKGNQKDFSQSSGRYSLLNSGAARSKDSQVHGSGIPVPRGYKIDSKIVKTEKNRLKLILRSPEQETMTDEHGEKEERITSQASLETKIKVEFQGDRVSRIERKEELPLRRGKQQSSFLNPDKPDLPVYPRFPISITPTYQLSTDHHQDSTLTSKNFTTTIRCKYKEGDNVMDSTEQEANQKIFSQSSRCYEEEGSSDDDIKGEDSSEGNRLSSLYHGTWPVKHNTWTAQGFSGQSASNSHEMASVMSFSSGSGCSVGLQGHRRLGAKVDVVYSLLGMLGSTEGREDMSGTLLAMSNSIDSCLVMRQSGCLPLLVQLIHAPGQDPETRERASRALHNVVHARTDEKIGRREARVLRLLEQVRDYCQVLRTSLETERPPDDLERHPGPTIAALMKLSFDEAHRHAMCQLGGLHAVAELIEMDHAAHGTDSDDQSCITLRRYAGMALTNLTFGDGNNKALLCSFREFMKALVTQLRSLSDDLRQVTASVLRNLSWRADSSSKQTLREVGAVMGLMRAAMEGRKESTLKSILSALWNLSAHCSTNKVDICAVDGALAFLVDMLSYKAPSKTLAIVENAGGILRNVSSHIAVREDYRVIVRERGCLQVLLRQLRSPSLTVVSNACGALWNLSARCPHDQRLLWDLGAVPMLRSLVHSKHKMISMGSSAALKNLLSARPGGSNLVHLDSTARGLGLPTLPTLNARRQRALEQEIDQNLSETCENIEPSTSPTTKDDKFLFKESSDSASKRNCATVSSRYNGVPRSESRESMRSVTSTHSDTIFERVNRHVINGFTPTEMQIKQQSSSLHGATGFNGQGTRDHNKTSQLEKKYALKYKNSIPERLRPTDLGITGSTISWTTGPDQESVCSFLRTSIEKKLSTASGGQSGSECSFTKIKTPSPISPVDGANFSGTFDVGFINKPIISPTSSHTSEGDPFGNYAETDLDQPTNYSLRYAERNSDEDEKQSSGYFAGSEQDIEDTVKTYCTEGTPYGTSLNSSRAASHSDLQDDGRRHERDSSLRPMPKPRSYAERVDEKHLSLTVKPIIIPTNSMETHSDIDSGVPVEEDETDTTEDAIIVESTITRLTSLVVDEESKVSSDRRPREPKAKRLNCGEPESLTESMVSDGEDDDEDLLAACIHVGMQNNRHRQSFRRDSLDKSRETNLVRYQTSTVLHQVDNNPLSEVNSQEESRIACEDEKNPRNEGTVTAERQENPGEMKSENPDAIGPESIDSYDSVERSEQVLLEFCIKSSSGNVETIGLSEPSSPSENVDAAQTDGSSVSKTKMICPDVPLEDVHEDEYRRQRDPDAMIASLDRLTATLVQQTEAMRERESSAMKQSIQSDTWNEDSPNDNSFPTISMSVPLVASFKSDTEDMQTSKISYNDHSSMTTSKIIEQEAFRLAEAVNAELRVMSLTNQDLDSIKPPSTMNSLISLTNSYAGPEIPGNSVIRDHTTSTSLPSALFKTRGSRKKSLPVGIMARRALGQTQSQSLESLLNDSSQLDNVKPPSMMDELLDTGDMESSMLSVASITSEIADRDQDSSITSSDPIFDLIKPVANVLSMTCLKYAENSANNSLSEYLENINPPSLFNEISDIDDTTIDANTDTMCSDTLCIDVELHTDEINPIIDRIEEVDNDTDEAATPISTEYSLSSSAESTPKKRLTSKNHLTPKQKRQLAKERYKTYTIAAELVKKEEEERRKQMGEHNLVSRPKLSPFSKLTPKQRRQEDRARFQTQVLETPLAVNQIIAVDEEKSIDTATVTLKTGIPSFRNFTGRIRQESRGRYRTRTIDESQRDQSNTEESQEGTSEEMQTMLEKNANIVLHTLSETKTDESHLDYETISLVSHESGAEINLKMRLEDGLGRNFSTFVKKKNSQPLEMEKETWRVEEVKASEDQPEEQDDQSSEGSESESETGVAEAKEQPKRPRITKPGSRETPGDIQDDKIEVVSPKGIRGRRKALYSKPTVKKITPQSSPLKQGASGIPIGRANPSTVVRATRATTLRQSTNASNTKHLGTNKTPVNAKALALSKRSSIPQRGSSSAPEETVKRHSTPPGCLSSPGRKCDGIKPLERQGTFTKDEPEMENTPMVINSPSKSKIAKPTRGSPSHVPVKSKISIRNFQSKLTKCSSADGIPSQKAGGTKRQADIGKNGEQINAQGGRKLGQRSSSNSSIVSAGGSQKLTKEATSKIASLWKKVEESRNKQRYDKPDTRQWITADSKTDGDIHQLPTLRLFRSSTFEGVPKETGIKMPNKLVKVAERSSYRNSCDLTDIDANGSCRVDKSGDKSDGKCGGVVLRKQKSEGSDGDAKRISRLGSFFRVDSENQSGTSQTNGSPAVPSLNYNQKCEIGIPTASSKVTTV